MTGYTDHSLFWHTCSLFSPSFCCQYRTWQKNTGEKKSRGISPKKAQSLAFPIIKSSCLFCRCMQTESSDYSGPCKNYPEWYMKIWHTMTYVCENKSISVPDSRASEKNAENVGSPLMRRTGQVPFSCRQLEIGLWAYNFFSLFTLSTVTLHVPLSMQASCNDLSTFNLLTSVIIVEVSPNS